MNLPVIRDTETLQLSVAIYLYASRLYRQTSESVSLYRCIFTDTVDDKPTKQQIQQYYDFTLSLSL